MKIIASVSKIEDLPEYWENPLQQKSFVKRSLFDNLMQESSLNILFQSLSFSDETIVNDSYSILELLCRGSRQRTALIYQLNIINYFPQTPNCNFGNILFDIISLLQIEITMPIRQLIHSMLLSTNCNHIQSALKIYNLAFSRKIVPLIEDVSSQYEPISRILLSKIPSIVVAALFLVNKFSILSDDVLFAVAISINTPGIKAPTKAISILRKFFGRLVELRNPIILSSLINSLQFSQFKLKLKVLKFLDMYAQFADFNDNSYIDTLMGFLDDSQLSFYALKILCVAFGQYESRGRVCDFYSVAKQFEESIIQILIGDNEVNSQLAQIIEPP
ncbi:hypothetical protein GPJ56_005677 [Histomonas meleagridis]|uniref:uncharacterized protein n=1 Tax=Histomonas meleagridis TaxID=135588 RepID=UPI00355A0325|nr:hypothetical protein GPJ56_005677 [Histomonas meleagridis]KAH0803388.1 hypothetical protein GO595_003732 [Histomonas meleagridis]